MKQVCCEGLKVHDDKITKKQYETYLGDVICSSGSNRKNIEKRTNCGVGAVSQILSTLSQVSLGHFHYEIALIFRDSMLVSKLVFSSEVWYNVKNEQYSKLEEIDEMFMRKIFDLPKSAPQIGLYAECGKIPIRYIIKTRRLLFYWHILHLDNKELLFKIYLAQKFKPGKNDWIMSVYKDMEEIGLKMTEEDIMKISKEKFKDIVQSKVNICFRTYFLKKPGSKTANIKIQDIFKPSSYMFSRKLNVEEIQTLFKLRTRTIDVKNNQESSFKGDIWCRTCSLFPESQKHIFECYEIIKQLMYLTFSEVKYEMIFGRLEEQEKFAKIYKIMLSTRSDIIKTCISPS